MRVGTSLLVQICLYPIQDHPHACGDKLGTTCGRTRPQGSSPCVWGQDLVTCEMRNGNGIIPMRVGTRQAPIVDLFSARDHPHACGDKVPVNDALAIR